MVTSPDLTFGLLPSVSQTLSYVDKILFQFFLLGLSAADRLQLLCSQSRYTCMPFLGLGFLMVPPVIHTLLVSIRRWGDHMGAQWERDNLQQEVP